MLLKVVVIWIWVLAVDSVVLDNGNGLYREFALAQPISYDK